ncbi:MAG TPA: peptidylprolyl isomerase [Longimicrobiaceae bacterium]|nr:peptidylprolyl isomerase [Longimicrobiaceae bacterium]
MIRLNTLLLLAAVAAAGCDQPGRAGDGATGTDVVARAAGHELSADTVARWLAADPSVPAEPYFVRVVADSWVDYTLLAAAAARDTSLQAIRLDRLVEADRERVLLDKLRERMVRPDTAVAEDEIRAALAREVPTRVRVRHILLRAPAGAAPARRDSAGRLAEQLRARAAEGEDFAALATRYSQDPATSGQGGVLDLLQRPGEPGGTSFEQAAFGLLPGQVGPVVRTELGFHVVKLESRERPDLRRQREPLRFWLKQSKRRVADSVFVDAVARAAGIRVRPGAAELLRALARAPGTLSPGPAAGRVLAAYRTGELTLGEAAAFLRREPGLARMLADAPDERVAQDLRQMVLHEILLGEAAARGITLSPAELRRLEDEARGQVRQALEQSGLLRRPLPGGAAAMQERVNHLIRGAVAGTRNLDYTRFSRLGAALREAHPPQINPAAYPEVVERLKRLRAGGAARGAPAPPGTR